MEPQGRERHRWVKPRGRKERERVSQSVHWRIWCWRFPPSRRLRRDKWCLMWTLDFAIRKPGKQEARPQARRPDRWSEGNQMLWRTSTTKSEARRPRSILAAASCIARPRSRAATRPAWLSLRWSAQDDPRGNHQSTRGFPRFPAATVLESPLEFLWPCSQSEFNPKFSRWEEGRKDEGRRKKEEGRRKKEEGRRRKEEGGRRDERNKEEVRRRTWGKRAEPWSVINDRLWCKTNMRLWWFWRYWWIDYVHHTL